MTGKMEEMRDKDDYDDLIDSLVRQMFMDIFKETKDGDNGETTSEEDS